MTTNECDRRSFIKTVLATVGVSTLDWEALPRAVGAPSDPDHFDAVVVGAGLGGLSCAAAFARQGFRPLVLEQHNKAGGYATTFKRPGGFEFDVSLHATSAGERNGVHNLIPGFPEITDVEFVALPSLCRVIYPDYDLRVPNQDVPAYVNWLKKSFPNEAAGIDGLFADMKGVTEEVHELSGRKGAIDESRFPTDYPVLTRFSTATWGQIVDSHLKDPKLKAIVSSQWGYYGLPPSKLASIYYGLPYYSYLSAGGFYPKGQSQKISNAMVSFIEGHGGKVLVNTRVEKVLVKDGAAYGVKTVDGHEYKGRAVVCNANAYDLFHTLLEPNGVPPDYMKRMDSFSVSLSTFQIFLGLNRDLVHEAGIRDSEISYCPDYDLEASYQHARSGDFSNPHFGMMLYDTVYPGYSPAGKNTVNLLCLQGYDHWKPYEADYRAGNKTAYRAEKNRMADILIALAEKQVLPGLSKAIEVKEIGTPLTNVRYTSNYLGAIYGWDQTLDNSMPRRIGHATPIKDLYLSGAWTTPGGGYGAVIPSGLECFGEIMKRWG